MQKIRELCLLDDSFMSRVFDENIECTELILRIILDRQDIKVREVSCRNLEEMYYQPLAAAN